MEARSVERKLAAIFAADVEGYSRLMGRDEVGTVRGGWYPPPAVVPVSEDDGLAVCASSFCLSCHTPMRDDPTIWSWIKEAEPEITEPDVVVVAVLIMASAA